MQGEDGVGLSTYQVRVPRPEGHGLEHVVRVLEAGGRAVARDVPPLEQLADPLRTQQVGVWWNVKRSEA